MSEVKTVTFKNSGVLDLYWIAEVQRNEVAPNPAWPAGSSITLEGSGVISGPLSADSQQTLNLTVDETNMVPANSPYMARVLVHGYADAGGTQFIETQELEVRVDITAYPLYAGNVNFNWYCAPDASWGWFDDNGAAVYTPASDVEYFQRWGADDWGFRLTRSPVTRIWTLRITRSIPETLIWEGAVDCDVDPNTGYPSGEWYYCRTDGSGDRHYWLITWGPTSHALRRNHNLPRYFDDGGDPPAEPATIKGKWVANAATAWGAVNADLTLEVNESCPGVIYLKGAFGDASKFRLGLTLSGGIWTVRATKGGSWEAPDGVIHTGPIAITEGADHYPDGTIHVTLATSNGSPPGFGFAGSPVAAFDWSFGKGVW